MNECLEKTSTRSSFAVKDLKVEAVIDKGLAGPGLLAHILTSKFSDFLPFYRLKSAPLLTELHDRIVEWK